MAKNTVVSHLDLSLPKTRIMATIGHANYEYSQLEGMLENGASIFRFNAARIKNGFFEFKNKQPVDVSKVLDDINLLSQARWQPITISLDLAGPKVRVKNFISYHKRGEGVSAKANEATEGNHPKIGDAVYLYSDSVDWKAAHIKETLNGIDPSRIQEREDMSGDFCVDETWRIQTTIHSFDTVKESVSLKDGKCKLCIESYSPQNDFIKAKVKEVANDFFFSSTQGVNPRGYMFPEILQDKDFKDFDLALENNFDLICVSFVCSPLEYFQLKKKIEDYSNTSKKNGKNDNKKSPLIFAKIETIFAVEPAEAKRYCQENKLDSKKVYGQCVHPKDQQRYTSLIKLYEENPIKAICETFDGVMVARGDLAVEADKYRVPFYQKAIIECCRSINKPVIIATEVLQSMTGGNPSTRAEVGDIATAVLDGADVIMLAGEVASTASDPAQVVKELKNAIQTAEDAEEKEKWIRNRGDVKYFYEKFSSLLHEGETHLEEMKERKLLTKKNVEMIRWKIGMGSRVCLAARAKDATAILVSVTTGETAKHVSYFRPVQQIISIGSNLEVARQLILWKGIYPVVMQYDAKHDLNDFILIGREIHHVVNIRPSGEWRNKQEFIIPGLLRIESKLQDGRQKKFLPNTVHEISLRYPPEKIPEREIKYILTEEYYKKLKKHLKNKQKFKQIRQIEQRNYYFFDTKNIVKKKKGMVRIRIERVDEEPERAILTIKKKSEKVNEKGKNKNSGTLERWEKEFNVTPYFSSNGLQIDKKVSFDLLPDFFKKYIWREFQKDSNEVEETKLECPTDFEFAEIANMTNIRLTVETHSELTLELDMFSTKENRQYYELEIETIAADEKKRDEHVRLLFELLGIPVVSHENYPSKFVRTLIDFGILAMSDEIRNAIGGVEKELAKYSSKKNRK